MAIAYLNTGATSLAAANWSDSTGFANAATLVIDGTRVGNQNITAGLDQSALGTGIESLDVYNYGGTIGGASGSLRCDADGTSEASATVVSRVRWWSPGTLYYSATGGSSLAHYFQQSGGTCYITGGTIKNLHIDKGVIACVDSVVGSGVWHLQGGQGSFDYHASNAIATAYVAGGSWLFQKKPTTLYVLSGASVTLDCQGLTPTNIYMMGGSLRLLSCGGVTNFYGWSGQLDLSGSQRAFTIGGTALELGGKLSVIPNPIVSFGTKSPIGVGAQGVA